MCPFSSTLGLCVSSGTQGSFSRRPLVILFIILSWFQDKEVPRIYPIIRWNISYTFQKETAPILPIFVFRLESLPLMDGAKCSQYDMVGRAYCDADVGVWLIKQDSTSPTAPSTHAWPWANFTCICIQGPSITLLDRVCQSSMSTWIVHCSFLPCLNSLVYWRL